MSDAPAPIRAQPLNGSRLDRFESFAATFRTLFHRSDQFLPFRAYLRGLLEPGSRKNVEGIATAAAAVMMVQTKLAQSLQHFVSNSPWDHHRLASALRRQNAPEREDSGAVWVIHDGVFAKKGRHSVGVQRQYARSLGQKINCQVGVFVSQFGPRGFYPLAARLYLPGEWLRRNAEVARKQIPEPHCQPATKVQLALGLLDGLREEGETLRPLVAEPSYSTNEAFLAELPGKGWHLHEAPEASLARALQHFEWLKSDFGLDHFEGRTWHGWHHHAALVFTAYHFLAQEAALLVGHAHSPA